LLPRPPPPAPVLAERQDLSQQVVAPRQPAEQLDRELVLCPAHRHFNSPHSGYCDGIRAEPVTKGAALDAERFAAWQRDRLEAKAGDSELLTIGPFQVALSKEKETPHTSLVTLVDGNANEAETAKAIPKLKAA